jgi:hypothetical protein
VYSQRNGLPGKPMLAENCFAWMFILQKNTRTALFSIDTNERNAADILKFGGFI